MVMDEEGTEDDNQNENGLLVQTNSKLKRKKLPGSKKPFNFTSILCIIFILLALFDIYLQTSEASGSPSISSEKSEILDSSKVVFEPREPSQCPPAIKCKKCPVAKDVACTSNLTTDVASASNLTTDVASESNLPTEARIKFPLKFHRQHIIMVKPGKVGGSTLSGVVRHIGAHYNMGHIDEEFVETSNVSEFIKPDEHVSVYAQHRKMDAEWQQEIAALEKPAFLLTIIRDPVNRCLSDYHFFQSHGTVRLDADFKDKVGYFERYCRNYMTGYISARSSHVNQNVTVRAMNRYDIDKVVGYYNLVGITERFNETMVLLKHMLGLKWRDVLYMPAKIAGATSWGSHDVKKYPSFEEESKSLKKYVEETFKDFRTNKDFYLYQKVTEEFEQKISQIPTFQEDLKRYEMILDTVIRSCSWTLKKFGPRSMLAKDHREELKDLFSGYNKDAGIGHICLDQVGDIDQFFN